MSILEQMQTQFEKKKQAKMSAKRRDQRNKSQRKNAQYKLRQTSYSKIEERIKALRETKK